VTAVIATAVEIVAFAPESLRANQWFDALEKGAKANGLDVYRTKKPASLAPWLLLWGPGDPTRAATMRRHVAGGGHVIALDLAYWDRERKARVSFDAPHPQAWVMRQEMPSSRFIADRVPVASTWNPSGPIVIAGLGDKARVQYGADTIDRWEASMAHQCRARWPKRPIVYRKKRAISPTPGWASNVLVGDVIDQALRGKSLVITWHSNVAVDAIRMGIPVICRDGAAAAVCPPDFGPEDPQPLSTETRDTFLGNLAWFQWAPNEARGFWSFVQGALL
jgi:hypothetical protein